MRKSSQFTSRKEDRGVSATLECNFGEIGMYIWGIVAFKLDGGAGHVVTLGTSRRWACGDTGHSVSRLTNKR